MRKAAERRRGVCFVHLIGKSALDRRDPVAHCSDSAEFWEAGKHDFMWSETGPECEIWVLWQTGGGWQNAAEVRVSRHSTGKLTN